MFEKEENYPTTRSHPETSEIYFGVAENTRVVVSIQPWVNISTQSYILWRRLTYVMTTPLMRETMSPCFSCSFVDG
jgi:hypothetical protein